MIFRAQVFAVALAVPMIVIAILLVLTVSNEFDQVPSAAQVIASIAFVSVVGWRFLRLGVVASNEMLVIRHVFKDVKIPWRDVMEIHIEESAEDLGAASVPCVRTTSGDYDIMSIAGFVFRNKPNARVVRQTDALRDYWQSRSSSE